MTLAIYRSRHTIFTTVPSLGGSGVKARALLQWVGWSFTPVARTAVPGRIPDLFHGCEPWPGVVIKPPHFAKLVEHESGQRLVFHGEEYGVDAESAAVLAFARQRGFQLAEGSG